MFMCTGASTNRNNFSHSFSMFTPRNHFSHATALANNNTRKLNESGNHQLAHFRGDASGVFPLRSRAA